MSKSDFKILTSSENNEWYTPKWITDLAKSVMGDIDLDPASCDTAQAWIKGGKYYSKSQNGFIQPWEGRVWLNPPYGAANVKRANYGSGAWCEKLLEEFDAGNVAEAMCLVGGTSEGMRKLSRRALWCRFNKRIAFVDFEGKIQKSPPPSPNLFYLGDRGVIFSRIFSEHGDIFSCVKTTYG